MLLPVGGYTPSLNALDNPYGTCRARINGNCPLVLEPPCLTANDGKPCFDLTVGMSGFVIKKYELHIESATKMIEGSKEYGLEDMVEVNRSPPHLYNIEDLLGQHSDETFE